MRARRRWSVLLLALIATAVMITAAVILSGQRTDAAPQTSAFDPSVPTSTHTPPPAGPASPTDAPSDAPGDDAPADDAPSDQPTGSPTPAAPAPTSEESAEVSAETAELLGTVLAQTAEIDPQAPTDVVGDLSGVATRSYLSELESERLEFETEGWSREGSYSLGDVEVLEHSSTSDGEVATVRVCVDSSDLVIRRADGEVIETSPSSARAVNVFVLERADSAAWRIVGRTFPDNPAC